MALPSTSPRGSSWRRHLDHVVGSPLLYALAAGRRPRPVPASVRSIGLLCCTTIGDAVIASAIGRDLGRAFPHARRTVFVAAAGRGLAGVLEGFDEEVVLPVTRVAAALRVLRAHPTDILIDFAQWPRVTAVLAALSRAGYTSGFRTGGTHRHFAYDYVAAHSAQVHEIDNFRALLAPFGIAGTAHPMVRPALCADHPRPSRRRVVVLHPWASGFRSHLREWAPANWVALAARLIAAGYEIAITGGPADRNRAESLAGAIDASQHTAVLAGYADLRQTVACLADAAAVVSVNTGTMHLAAALDCPMVALHGPTNPRRWGPLSEAAQVVGPDRDRGGAYLHLGFEHPASASNCMALITVDEVWARLRACLDGARERADQRQDAARPAALRLTG